MVSAIGVPLTRSTQVYGRAVVSRVSKVEALCSAVHGLAGTKAHGPAPSTAAAKVVVLHRAVTSSQSSSTAPVDTLARLGALTRVGQPAPLPAVLASTVVPSSAATTTAIGPRAVAGKGVLRPLASSKDAGYSRAKVRRTCPEGKAVSFTAVPITVVVHLHERASSALTQRVKVVV